MQSLTIEKQLNANPLLSTRINHNNSMIPLNTDRNNDVSKSFADLRLKLGNKKRDELDDNEVPSDLSGDEWAEILKYEHEKY
jgi:hypothetical protein